MILREKDKMYNKMEFSNNLFNISTLDKPGMMSIRTELTNKKLQNVIKDVFKLNVPKKLEVTSNKNLFLACMSQNELLLISKNKNEGV